MIFNFLKWLWGPEAGYAAMRASYDKHYQLAIRNGIEPISSALYGALASRYQLRGIFRSELIHMIEITPFAMMPQDEGRDRISDYVLIQEIPEHVDAKRLRISINYALTEPEGEIAEDSYKLLLSALPHLEGSGIQWFAWLDRDTAELLVEDAARELKAESKNRPRKKAKASLKPHKAQGTKR